MGTERMEEKVAACPCGKGAIKERSWSNDYPFASDYSWHSDGMHIDCDECAKAWVINGSDAKAVRLATRASADAAAKHNAAVNERLLKLASDRDALEQDLRARVRALQKSLVTKAETAGAGVEAKFNAVGDALGLSTLDEFRAAVGRSLPKTYIPRFITPSTTPAVLVRVGRDSEAESFRQAHGKIRVLAKSCESLRGEMKNPPTAMQMPRVG